MSNLSQKQTTLAAPVSFTGVGLHTGAKVTVTLVPAQDNFGYKFQRIDLVDQPIIEADCDLVTDTSRGTTLEKNGVKISTIEHVLAALVGSEVDNALIQIDGPEMPIMDGSSIVFVKGIEETGIRELDEEREYFEIPYNINYTDAANQVEIIAMPVNEYRLTVMVDYNSPVLGTQHAALNKISDFASEIAPCRTFSLYEEILPFIVPLRFQRLLFSLSRQLCLQC
jgi:UDP-3-O-[3-hydroxymyristoyl] N-acetylglucosamine deacetylase/3-hydroxyacyl-[acyl-carrier-protein] dehydratase